MGPMDDPELSRLLREWKVEDAPASLNARVPGLAQPWWRFLLGGSLRVPVPVALAAALALLVMSVALLRPRPSSPTPANAISLVEFRPVQETSVRIMVDRYEAR